jgi:acetyl-CoA carboxylase carboxyltransferase component
MNMHEEIERLRRTRAEAMELGGPERIARQRRSGKWTVRERVD